MNVCLKYSLRLSKLNFSKINLQSIAFQAWDNNQTVINEKVELLNLCMQNLKINDRSIVVLHLEGLAYREISEITGLTENHIAVKMKRIKKNLFDCIKSK